MTYIVERLAEQRVADLRRAASRRRVSPRATAEPHGHVVREKAGRALVRLGERLAAPSHTPATR